MNMIKNPFVLLSKKKSQKKKKIPFVFLSQYTLKKEIFLITRFNLSILQC